MVGDDRNASALEGLEDLFSDAAEEKLLKEANLKTYEEYNLRRDENRARLEAEMDRPREFSIGHWMWQRCAQNYVTSKLPRNPRDTSFSCKTNAAMKWDSTRD